jgi:hypothetical protein
MAQSQTLSQRIELRKEQLLLLQQTRGIKSNQSTALEERILSSKNRFLASSKALDKYLTWNSLLLTGGFTLYRLLRPKK